MSCKGHEPRQADDSIHMTLEDFAEQVDEL
jgi:hypothetical protein